ncbi:hypothetical protein [Candidatus Tisiphia endosymbiont of Hybos culiciformis]|uniref:hypothetical protein n=1 Tax=Candidatus Tisiphia endosymbiont of Hybos culiciformis TaxID=3139331 RepID=UPI003CCB4ED0
MLQVYLLSEQQRKIKNIIENKFPDWHLTHLYLEQLEKSLDYHSDSPGFMEEILLGIILEKASSLEEYSNFLKLINKHNISQQEIISDLGYASLANIIDVIETKILSESLKNLEGLVADDSLARISQFCYQLKSKGWSVSNLVEILQYIKANNILFFVSGFKTIYEYQITDEQRNKEGETVVDIVSKCSGKELEPAIYTIASNQFEHKLENKGTELLAKFVELNPDLKEKSEEYVAILQRIQNLYSASDNDSGLAIKDWNAEQVKEWAIKFKASCSPGSIIDKDNIVKLIAVLQRANNLHTLQNGKEGHLLRDTQIVSLLLLLDYEPINKGKLLQIATGEGKSTISAMLAAILALNGEKVDLITSSSVLSTIGYEGASGFFELLGLSVGINIGKSSIDGQKACYSCDIVYGDALSFQTDFLSNTSCQGARRGDRDFAVTIVDEVDSMLVDSSNHVAKQTSPVPLMEYLLPILTIAWDNFQKVILPMNFEESFAIEKTREMIESIIDASPIPKHLVQYAKFQAGNWAASLVGAAIRLQLDRDYVININVDGKKVINPVDSSTGVTQENMVWQNGLHQFLQIKHNCRISSEGLTTFFISNICYFLKYGKVLGMTGTLGSDSSQKFLKTVYGVALTFVPTYKDKQVVELPARLEPTSDDLREAVCDSSYQEAILHNRAVLIICKDIKDSEDICTALKNKCGSRGKIINYSRSEKTLYNSDIEQLAQPNTIIVATNLAGRGTDIKTSLEVEANGGLHVISTFIAKNARDEAQVKGRTARQGNSGSYQIIALDSNYYEYQSLGISSQEVVAAKQQERDAQESYNVTHSIEHTIPGFLAQDDLYQKFTAVYSEFAKAIGDKRRVDGKIKQFIEDFGLWLKTHKESDNIDTFIAAAKAKYQAGSYSNPSYAVLQHYGLSDSGSILRTLSKATDIDDIYNFAAHYYTAECFINRGPENDDNYKNNAISSLLETGNRLSEILSYLTAMATTVASSTSADNQLLKQVTTKIGFFKSLYDHINSAIKVINESGELEVRVKSNISKEKLAPDLSKDDILEIDFLGINAIFELETYKPRQEWQNAVLVAVCAIAQMAVGALIAVGTMGGGMTLATGIFIEGLMDAYKVAASISTGKAINLEDYFLGKAISYAVIGVQVGCAKLAEANAARKAATEGTKQAVTKAATEKVLETTVVQGATNELKLGVIKQLAKTAGVQFAKTIAIEQACNWASNGIRENVLDGVEERIAGSVSKVASNALSHNAILLGKGNVERHQMMTEIHQSISYATKTREHARIINELVSGVTSAAAKQSDLAHAIHVAHKMGSMMDIASKLEPIIDDIKHNIETSINRAVGRAKAKFKEQTMETSSSEQDSKIADLSKEIGNMVGRAMLNLIQGKLVTPILGSGIGLVADKLLENYQKDQMNQLNNYKRDIDARNAEPAYRPVSIPKLSGSPPDPKLSGHPAPAPNLPWLTSGDLVLDSLSRKSTSMVGNDLSMGLLSSSLKQPIYVFENGKLLQSYGKSQGGKPITIGYNSNDQQYFSFTNKGSSNTGSIYDAISGSTQGKYSAGLLQSIACPVSASSGTPPPPPLPKLPSGSAAGGQPLYSFNTAGSNEIALPPELLGKPVPPITVPKDIPPSNKPAVESTGFKWTEEGMASLFATGKTKDNQPFDYSMLFLNRDEQEGKGLDSATTYSKLTAEEKAQIIALSDGHFDPDVIDRIETIYNKCLAEIEGRKDQPVKSVEDRMDQAVKYTSKILEDAGNDPYKMQVAEYRIGGEVTGLILRSIMDNIRNATDQLPKTKALLTTPLACAGEIVGYVVKPAVDYIDPKGEIRQAIHNIPDEGTKTLIGLTGGVALGAGAGAAVKGVVDVAKKAVLKAAGIEAVGGVGSALTATEGATTLGKGAVAGEIAGIGKNALVGDLGLAEFESNAIIQEIVGVKPMVSGTPRELAALYAKLASQEQGAVIAGVGHARAIKDINRLIETYGGTKDEWVKISTNELNKNQMFHNGTSLQIHYYKNLKTGQKVEFKLKNQ